MKKSLMFLLSGLCLTTVLSCGGGNNPTPSPKPTPTPGGTVTSDEWNEAVENIVNVNKNNSLNYIASGDLTIKDPKHEDFAQHINKLEINGDYGYTATIGHEGLLEQFSLKKSFSYLQLGTVNGTADNCFIVETPLSYFFSEILDIYGNIDSFNYLNGKYIVKPEEAITPFGTAYLEITFNNDKKINSIMTNYDLKEEEEGGERVVLQGTLSFVYGTSTLDRSKFPAVFDDYEKKHYINLNESNSYVHEFPIDDSVFVTIDVGNKLPISNTLEFYYKFSEEDYFAPFRDDDYYLKVYKNGKVMKRGSEAKHEDYYLTGPSKTGYEFRYLNFSETLKTNDKIEMLVTHTYTTGGYTAIATAQFIEQQ